MQDLVMQKAELRRRIRKQRREQDPETLRQESLRACERLLSLPELQTACCVFCYVSCKGEAVTLSLIEQLLSQGKHVLVPRCKDEGQMDCVEIHSLNELVPGMMNIPEPPPEAPVTPSERVEFAVVPALACGEDGSRLGQGGGYYDRFLEQANCSFAALCLDAFLLPSVPTEEHDRRMMMIVTQSRLLRFEDV